MSIHFKSLIFELSKQIQTSSTTKSLHALLIKTHLLQDPFYATKIIRFYAINNDLISARQLFDETPLRTVYLWNSIIRAYARTHQFPHTFKLYKQMLFSKTKPDNFTFACILRAFSENRDFNIIGVKLVHAQVIISNLQRDPICSSALVSAYSKLTLVHDARTVFDGLKTHDLDLVLYNTMITGYTSCGFWKEALHLFIIMRKTGNPNPPDEYTVVGLLSGFTSPNVLAIGEDIHGYCLKNGFDSNPHISSVLVSMYSKCNCMNSARKVFDSLSQPDLVTWSALISGFSQSREYRNAFDFFKIMNKTGKKTDSILVATLLAVVAQTVVLGPGVEIHGYAIRHNLDSNIMVSSALIDMYSKCGFLEFARKVFDKMPKRNIVSYNSLISSFGLYGQAFEAFNVFNEVVKLGLKPDDSTFSGLLSACSHGGLVNEGRDIFNRMEVDFGVKPKTEHYVYFVKLVGMAGYLIEAYNVIESLGEDVDSGILGAFLSCCEVHNDLKMAGIVAQRFFDDKRDESRYKIMVSNFYAGNGRWDDVKKLRDGLDDVGNKKECGISWISRYKG